MNIAQFCVDREKCIGCGNCTKVCPGGILCLDEDRKAKIKPITEFGWNGCWKCEHCLSVCPTGAISVLGHHANDKKTETQKENIALDNLIRNRHSCRRYLDKNVDPQVIREMLDTLANAPNGGNKQQVEFTLIDDKEQMDAFRRTAYERMETLAGQGIYPEGFDRTSYRQMKEGEPTVRPDMIFCGAPHILIPHAPQKSGTPRQDSIIAGTYFELLCASHGLGAVIMTFPLDALKLMPDIMGMLKIPEDHFIPMIIGFGYPQIRYHRGVQKKMEEKRIHRPLILSVT